MRIEINKNHQFCNRHNGPAEDEVKEMLQLIEASDLNQLIEQTIPSGIRLDQNLNLPAAQSETDFLASFSKLMKKNKLF